MGLFVQKGGVKSPGSGRNKGVRNKISMAFLEALAKDFDEGGMAAIKIMRIERPAEYVKCIASILPKELEISDNRLAEIPDDELEFIIEHTRRQLAARLERAERREDETAH
jgi:hypothetical protein